MNEYNRYLAWLVEVECVDTRVCCIKQDHSLHGARSFALSSGLAGGVEAPSGRKPLDTNNCSDLMLARGAGRGEQLQ